MKVSYRLENCLPRMQENPDKFEMPDPGEMESIEVGQFVKLVFLISHQDASGDWIETGERMWVKVTKSEFPFYTGILDNDPFSTDQIKSGIELNFEAQNIIEIYR